jgi:hypothetical protein
MNEDNRHEVITRLREFADFLEAHPDAPAPYADGIRFDVFALNKEEFVKYAKAIGGKLEKIHDYSTTMVLRRQFGQIEYDINVAREEVCKRVVTGKKLVAAVEAVPEHEEDITEWRCTSILQPEVEQL